MVLNVDMRNGRKIISTHCVIENYFPRHPVKSVSLIRFNNGDNQENEKLYYANETLLCRINVATQFSKKGFSLIKGIEDVNSVLETDERK